MAERASRHSGENSRYPAGVEHNLQANYSHYDPPLQPVQVTTGSRMNDRASLGAIDVICSTTQLLQMAREHRTGEQRASETRRPHISYKSTKKTQE